MTCAGLLSSHHGFTSILFSPIGLLIGLVSLFIVMYIDTRRESRSSTFKYAAGSFFAALVSVWRESKTTFLIMIALIAGGGLIVLLSVIPIILTC